MFDTFEGFSELEDTNEKTKCKMVNDNLFSILFLSISGTAAVVVERHRIEEGERLGHGQSAWKALTTKHNAYMRETRHVCSEQLADFRMEQGKTLKASSSKLKTFESAYKPPCRRRFQTSGFRTSFSKVSPTTTATSRIPMHHRDRTFRLEEMKTTMKNIKVGNLSRRDKKLVRNQRARGGDGDTRSRRHSVS